MDCMNIVHRHHVECDGNTRVFVAATTIPPTPPEEQWRRLSEAERQRADAMTRPSRLAEFITGRNLLATLIDELGIEHARWELDPEPGPPAFALWPTDRPKPRVSISHISGYCAVAIGFVDQLGIDLEGPARQVRGPEIADYLSWPPIDVADPQRFRLAWTLWEATAKALHGGVFQRNNAPFRQLAEAFIDNPSHIISESGWFAYQQSMKEVLITIAFADATDCADRWQITA